MQYLLVILFMMMGASLQAAPADETQHALQQLAQQKQYLNLIDDYVRRHDLGRLVVLDQIIDG